MAQRKRGSLAADAVQATIPTDAAAKAPTVVTEETVAKMREIIARNAAFKRQVVSREDAIALFESKGERFKVELIRDLPGDQEISLYSQGEWIDLCRGRRRGCRESDWSVASALQRHHPPLDPASPR